MHFDYGATMPQAVYMPQAFNFPCNPCRSAGQTLAVKRLVATAPYCLATGSGLGASASVLR